jgi:hypothetical protein
MADQQGTGKHPHKSTEEPYPHHEGRQQGEQRENRSQQQQQGSSERSHSGSQSESGDLKQREYRDEQGNIHYHTRTSQEQQKK